MPFTGSHPAAVLPFLRTALPASALVIGSMVPDLPLFLPFRVPFDAVVRSHTPLGILALDLPAGVVLWLAWHAVLAPAAYAAAPAGLVARLADADRPGLRRRVPAALLVLPALVLGAATHVLWDEFTHAGRWGERHVAVLAAVEAGRPGWLWAQYLSGVLGLAVLAGWLLGWWARTRPASGVTGGPAWPWVLVVAAGSAAALSAALGAGDLRDAAYLGVVRGSMLAGAVAVALALAWHARRRLTRRHATGRAG